MSRFIKIGEAVSLLGVSVQTLRRWEQTGHLKPAHKKVAESTIENLINSRHGKINKMQWTRKGAHRVLQIRSLMISNDWDLAWTKVKNCLLKNAA